MSEDLYWDTSTNRYFKFNAEKDEFYSDDETRAADAAAAEEARLLKEQEQQQQQEAAAPAGAESREPQKRTETGPSDASSAAAASAEVSAKEAAHTGAAEKAAGKNVAAQQMALEKTAVEQAPAETQKVEEKGAAKAQKVVEKEASATQNVEEMKKAAETQKVEEMKEAAEAVQKTKAAAEDSASESDVASKPGLLGASVACHERVAAIKYAAVFSAGALPLQLEEAEAEIARLKAAELARDRGLDDSQEAQALIRERDELQLQLQRLREDTAELEEAMEEAAVEKELALENLERERAKAEDIKLELELQGVEKLKQLLLAAHEERQKAEVAVPRWQRVFMLHAAATSSLPEATSDTSEATLKEQQLLRSNELLLLLREQAVLRQQQQQRCELLQLCLPEQLLQRFQKRVEGPLLLET
ncbi:hypothetical protein cyc_03914 [Cyclospora cayetanensis]|uniref:Uncharacterized protein n=1 Tax=Cyclospora cayetanensis TaxID=88456 RepID=A0A1D3CXE9_9EIME|nr:hypothetical protein cyc_03914 [Cyclospora cayetanensis]